MHCLGRGAAGALTTLALLCCGSQAFGQDQDQTFQKRVNLAVDRGIEFLKKQQLKEGGWDRTYDGGMTALAAWTLLECGVPPEDEAIQKGAEVVRKYALAEIRTYPMALYIFFLDRLGDPVDVPLIQAMGLRLLRDQQASGGWGYYGTVVSDADKRTLAGLVEARKKLIKEKSPTLAASAKVLPAALAPLGLQLAHRTPAQMDIQPGDNSNTQFAMLALWVSGRYGVPTQQAFRMVEGRFRSTLRADGRWDYNGTAPQDPVARKELLSTAMTCAGLLGLALGHGNDKDRIAKKSITLDPHVRLAFARLSKVLEGTPDAKDTGPTLEEESPKRYYFLWSLERAAVVYNLKKIGPTDWYQWGAKKILESQGDQGSWEAEFGHADTCFCLLFLKKVNIAEDLTAKLNKTQPKAGRLPDDLLDLQPVEDPTKKSGTKKTPEKPKQSSWLQTPASPFGDRREPLTLAA